MKIFSAISLCKYKGPVDVVLDALDDDVGIYGEDGDERRIRVTEQYVNEVEDVEQFVLLAAVQSIHHDHHPRVVASEGVHGSYHPANQVDLGGGNWISVTISMTMR